MIRKIREEGGKLVVEFFQALGIDPMHAFTALFLLVACFQIKKIKKWRQQDRLEEMWIILILYASVLFCTISVLRLFGVIKH